MHQRLRLRSGEGSKSLLHPQRSPDQETAAAWLWGEDGSISNSSKDRPSNGKGWLRDMQGRGSVPLVREEEEGHPV